MNGRFRGLISAAALLCASVTTASADDADLAKALANPLAALISVPFQLNYDQGFGSADGDRWRLNVQPVVPITLNDDWNLISRTIVPIQYQSDIFGKSGSQFGLGDTTQSLWLSPSAPTAGGLVWGLGGVLYIPTATNSLMGVDRWGAGPTAVALVQRGPWTTGFLANHIWSFGDSTINSSFLQPFVNYTTPNAWSFALNTESTYDWNTASWSVPVNFTVSKVVAFGMQPVSLTAGVRYYAASSPGGATGWGGRLGATFLFPR